MIHIPVGKITSEFLTHVQDARIPESFIAARPIIEKQHKLLCDLANQPEKHKIYGVNTLVGHIDNTPLSFRKASEFQQFLVRNHALQATSRYYDNETAKHITFSRAWFYNLGGGGISLQLYDILIKAIGDNTFRPRIPADLSYSCGDVIPGANWANALMEYAKKEFDYVLQPKEGLSLMNGVFVQAGTAVASVRMIQALWGAIMQCGKINAILCNANQSNYSNFLCENSNDILSDINLYLRRNQSFNRTYSIQDPVSIRAFPQAASGLHFAAKSFFNAIDIALQRRSDNPLISDNDSAALSQGSFIMTEISLAAAQLTDAILMLAWISERRLNHMLSGKVEGIPVNFSFSPENLDFIQFPKMAAAILENMRKYAGIKTFSSGSSTSYGVEDFWSFGLQNINVLREVINDLMRIITIEFAVYAEIDQHKNLTLKNQFHILTQISKHDLYSNFESAQQRLWKYYGNEEINL